MNKNETDLLKCAVYVKGELVSYVNPKILDKQNAWDKLEIIKDLHACRHSVLHEMQVATDVDTIQSYYDFIVSIETVLQSVWGFEKNLNYFKFWTVPHCSCPVYDNDDNYPHGPYIYNMECKVHQPRN